jgi:hypothetical protein
MIINIPTPDDYIRTGNELFISAWCSATSLLINRLESFGYVEMVEPDIILNEYFESIQTNMRSSLALVQQGVEFYLKARICEVSPFLLIGSKPENWPRNCSHKDIAFSDFRALDAQDLVKVINTVCKSKLSDEFIEWFNSLREKRNKFIHSVSIQENLKEIDIIKNVLDAIKFLQPNMSWMDIRKASLVKSTEDVLSRLHQIEEVTSNAYNLGILQREFLKVVDSLTPAESKTYFSFDKKKRRFICETCLSSREKEYFFELKNEEHYYTATAIKLSATEHYCLICKDETVIEDKNPIE